MAQSRPIALARLPLQSTHLLPIMWRGCTPPNVLCYGVWHTTPLFPWQHPHLKTSERPSWLSLVPGWLCLSIELWCWHCLFCWLPPPWLTSTENRPQLDSRVLNTGIVVLGVKEGRGGGGREGRRAEGSSFWSPRLSTLSLESPEDCPHGMGWIAHPWS